MTTPQRLLSTRLFSVERRVFEEPGGRTVVREVVVHPGAVVIVPILPDGRIVMIRNFRYTVQEELLELPAGTIDPGEKPIDTARRELEEETGYRPGVLEPLAEFYTSPGVMTERMRAFVARDLVHVGQRLQESEKISVTPVTITEASRMLREARIQDGKTLAALGVYLARQQG